MTRLDMREQRSGEDRRQEQDMNGPWWVNAILKVGVPAAIALYLVYVLAGFTGKAVEAMPRMDSKVEAHIKAFDEFVKAEEAKRNLDLQHQFRIEAYMRLVCSHGSRTREEQNTCNSVR